MTITIPIWLIWAFGIFIGIPIALVILALLWVGLVFGFNVATRFK